MNSSITYGTDEGAQPGESILSHDSNFSTPSPIVEYLSSTAPLRPHRQAPSASERGWRCKCTMRHHSAYHITLTPQAQVQLDGLLMHWLHA